MTLTEKALAAIGRQPSVEVPLLDLPWRDDSKDRSDNSARARGTLG